jgi:hypothetical protein
MLPRSSEIQRGEDEFSDLAATVVVIGNRQMISCEDLRLLLAEEL